MVGAGLQRWSEMVGVAQLQEVFAGVGLLDASVGMVLQPQHQFMLALVAKQVAHADMGGEVVAGRQFLLVRDGAPGHCGHASA